MKNTPAFRIAICGLLGALAVVLMTLGGIIPVAVYCGPMLAALLLVPLLELCSRKICFGWYAVVALLSLLLCPDKETALVFTFLGWYPVARERLDRLPKVLRFIVKLLIFNAAIALMYALTIFVFRLEAVVTEFRSMGLWLLIGLLALGNVVFIIFDLLLGRMTVYFHNRKDRM